MVAESTLNVIAFARQLLFGSFLLLECPVQLASEVSDFALHLHYLLFELALGNTALVSYLRLEYLPLGLESADGVLVS